MSDSDSPNQRRQAQLVAVNGPSAPPGYLPLLDAFQSAFAGYLARNVSLEQLRRVVGRCVGDARNLAQRHRQFIHRRRRGAVPATIGLPGATGGSGAPPVEADEAPQQGGGRAVRSGRVLSSRFVLQENIGAGGTGILYRAIDFQHPEAAKGDGTVAIKMLSPEYRHCSACHSLPAVAKRGQPGSCRIRTSARCMSWTAVRAIFSSPWNGWKASRSPRASIAPGRERWPGRRPTASCQRPERGWSMRTGGAIVHGDVKPGNVFVTVDGQVKLLDFGQARVLGAASEPVPRLAVSPAYASCELHEGAHAEVGDDVFALAVMAYRILAGARPFGRYTPLKAERAGITVLRPAGLGRSQWRMLKQGLGLAPRAAARERRRIPGRVCCSSRCAVRGSSNPRCTSRHERSRPLLPRRSSIEPEALTV